MLRRYMHIWMDGYIDELWGLYYLPSDMHESDLCMFVQAQTGAYFLCVFVQIYVSCMMEHVLTRLNERGGSKGKEPIHE